jgi:hypothetical protein
LRLHNSTGFADITVGFNLSTKPHPVVGDWTGAFYDTVGVADQSNGLFSLCNANVTATCANSSNVITLVLGNPNEMPMSGRWSPSVTHAGVGVFRPSNELIYLRSTLTTGYADYTMVLGIPSDAGLAGDWNGKGFDAQVCIARRIAISTSPTKSASAQWSLTSRLRMGSGGMRP